MISAKTFANNLKINWPLKKMKLTQGFGENATDFYRKMALKGHNGLDLRTQAPGNPKGEQECIATFDGTITSAGTDHTGGVYIHLQSFPININGKNYTLRSIYYHLKNIKVKTNDKVKEGDVIGITNNTGAYTTGAHLHFGIKILQELIPLRIYGPDNIIPAQYISDKKNGYSGAQDPEVFFRNKDYSKPYKLPIKPPKKVVEKKEELHMQNKFKFLSSIRFWKLVVAGVVEALVAYGVVPAEIGHSVAGVLTASVAVRTVDKAGGN